MLENMSTKCSMQPFHQYGCKHTLPKRLDMPDSTGVMCFFHASCSLILMQTQHIRPVAESINARK
jgi:hypothetical protein